MHKSEPGAILPFSGIRILDLTVMTAGPVGTMLLADLGADVIKVEEIGAGDLSRNIGTLFLGGESVQFLAENRNKRSIRLDLKHPEGRELFLRLARQADVITENFRPGTVDRLGIGHEAVRKVKPDIIYVSVSAFGQTGPYAGRPANDPIVQALGGIMASTGLPGEPVRLGYPYPDFGGATLLAFSVSTALFHRARTGQGQRIDTSLLEGVLFSSIPRDGETLVTGKSPRRQGSAHGSFAPYQNFLASDGAHVFVSCFTERFWSRLCDALDEPDWKTDPRFSSNPARVANQDQLAAEIQSRFEHRSADEWVEHLAAFEVPAAKVQDLHEALTADPQLAHNRVLVEQQHARAGTLRTLAHPIRFHDTPAQYRSPPPILGEHTAEVLREFGLGNDEIDALRASGVIADISEQAEPAVRESGAA